MASGERFARALFGVLILVVFIWFFLVGTLESGNTKTNRTLSSQSRPTKGSLKHVKVIGGVDKLHVHPSSDLNYMSKRRVPNGPDPIHNRFYKCLKDTLEIGTVTSNPSSKSSSTRRSGNSGRPPGQV